MKLELSCKFAINGLIFIPFPKMKSALSLSVLSIWAEMLQNKYIKESFAYYMDSSEQWHLTEMDIVTTIS